MSMPRSRKTTSRWCPSSTVPSARVFSAQGSPGRSDSMISTVAVVRNRFELQLAQASLRVQETKCWFGHGYVLRRFYPRGPLGDERRPPTPRFSRGAS
jgi:hypothetical protein